MPEPPPKPSHEIPGWARPRLLDLITECSSEFHYIQDARGALVYVSPSVERLLGYTPREFVEHCRDIPDWNSPRTLEARANWDNGKDSEPGTPRPPYLVDVRHRDGSRRTHEVFERWQLDPDGRRFLLGTALDVTERVIAESRFDRMQELTGVVNYFGIFTDNGLEMKYLGPSYERVFRVPRERAVEDFRAFMTHLHPDDLGPLRDQIRLIASGGGPDEWNFRYRVLAPDGRARWVSDRGVLDRGNDGTPRQLIGLAEDVTEQVLAEQEQRRREAALVQSRKLEAVGRLAAGVAHNFSNLLLAIQGYSDLARRTLEPHHPAVGALSKIEETSEQARGVTRSLLTLTRQRPTRHEAIDLSASLESAVRLLRRTLPTTVRVHHTIEPGLMVMGDSAQIDQVVLNTALNARDAMPDGGRLTISLARDADHALLTLEDTGTGMDEATRTRAFEPFFTTKPPDEGTGLGLSITRGIVAEHAGAIELRSTPGVGTRVEVRLPTLTSSPLRAEPADRTERGPALVVLPPGLVRRVVSTMLAQLGFAVEFAESLDGAHKRLRSSGVAALIVDPDAVPERDRRSDAAGMMRSLIEELGPHRVVVLCDSPEACRALDPGPRGTLLCKPFMQTDLDAALTGGSCCP